MNCFFFAQAVLNLRAARPYGVCKTASAWYSGGIPLKQGTLAGMRAGIHEPCGQRVPLATLGPRSAHDDPPSNRTKGQVLPFPIKICGISEPIR